MFFLDLWRLQLQTLQWKSLFEVLSSEGNLAGRLMPPKPIKICAVCFRCVSAKGDLLTLLIISPPAERKYVSHYERLEIDCGPLADARRVWLAAVPGIIAEPDSSEEPVPHLAGPRQSVRPRRRPGLPSVSGRAGSLALFGTAYANAAARTKSRQKVLEITVIRGVSLSFYGETPHLRRLQRLMMHLGGLSHRPLVIRPRCNILNVFPSIQTVYTAHYGQRQLQVLWGYCFSSSTSSRPFLNQLTLEW